MLMGWPKICIKYRKHRNSSFSHTFNCVCLDLFIGFENEGDQLFLIWVIFWILIWKLSWVFCGKIDVSLENNFCLPKSARSAQTFENSHSFFNVSYTWYKSLVCPPFTNEQAGKTIIKSYLVSTLLLSFWLFSRIWILLRKLPKKMAIL